MKMAVTHDGFSRFCYYTELLPLGTCSGWYQDTLLLYLVDSEAVDILTRAEWREQYGKKRN